MLPHVILFTTACMACLAAADPPRTGGGPQQTKHSRRSAPVAAPLAQHRYGTPPQPGVRVELQLQFNAHQHCPPPPPPCAPTYVWIPGRWHCDPCYGYRWMPGYWRADYY